MRIAVVIHTLPPYSLGGSELCAASLATELSKRHTVTVCAGRPVEMRSLPRHERASSYTIEWLDADPSRPPTFDAAFENDSIEAQFDEVMSRAEPEIVHFHATWELSNNLPMIARRRGASVVFTLHDFWLMCPRGQRLRPSDLTQCHEIDMERCCACLEPWIAPRRFPSRQHVGRLFNARRPPLRTLFSQARTRLLRPRDVESGATHVERYHAKTHELIDNVDLFIAPSRFLAHEFERRYNLPCRRLIYSDNGIDTALFDGFRYKQAATIVRFGFVGSWMPSKGVHILIEAFSGLTENARLHVFGGPPSGAPDAYTRNLMSAAAGDRRITFPGRLAAAERAEAFRAIDVLVVPSLWYENAPLTIREAFASHTPVVASRSGGMAECVRDGIDGLLFTTGSVTALRAALRRLIHEPDLIPSLSRQTPPVKSIAAHATELDAVFRQLTAPHRSVAADHHAYSASRS